MAKSEATCQVCGEVIAASDDGIIMGAQCPNNKEHPVRLSVWSSKPEKEAAPPENR